MGKESALRKVKKQEKEEERLKSEEKKSTSKEKGIIVRMLSEQIGATGEFKIPQAITKILGIGDAKQVFITLYNDRTICIEKAPEQLFVIIPEKPEVIPPTPVKPHFKKRKPAKPKVPVKEIPADWIPLAKTYFLTPEGDIRRPSKHCFLNKENVVKAARILKESATREEAIKRLTDELKYSESLIDLAYPLIKKALPHLEKMLSEKLKISEEAKPEVKGEAPKELVEVLRKKEEEKISPFPRRVES